MNDFRSHFLPQFCQVLIYRFCFLLVNLESLCLLIKCPFYHYELAHSTTFFNLNSMN